MIDREAMVAHVLSDWRVVINAGEQDGVGPYDKFLIYGHGPDIIDPLTNENLGPLEIVRGQAKVTHLQPKVATLRSTETQRHAGTRKIVKRGGALVSMLSQSEEIEDGPRVEEIALNGPIVGDYARPI